jgi:voltage-gated potassium channel
MNTKKTCHHEHVGVFQLVILVLSILVLGALFVDTAFKLPEQISIILDYIDTAVCVLLLVDFGIRFKRAESKLAFMKWGWIDLIASIPNLAIFRAGRMIRILRVIRLLRTIRATHKISTIIFQNRLHGTIASVFVTFLLLITFSSVGILICEQGPNAKITTAMDAVWWSVATITTVGYGDLYPITTEGRILAMILMLTGVGMFGAVSGMMASVFLGQSKKEPQDLGAVMAQLKRLEEQIAELKTEKQI